MYDSVYSTAVCFIYIHRGSCLLPWCQKREEFLVERNVYKTLKHNLCFMYFCQICFIHAMRADMFTQPLFVSITCMIPWQRGSCLLPWCQNREEHCVVLSLQNINHWVNWSTNSALCISVKTVSFMLWRLILCMILFTQLLFLSCMHVWWQVVTRQRDKETNHLIDEQCTAIACYWSI